MKKLLIFIGLVFFITTGCKKDPETLPPPDKNGYIWLRNVKSLPLIKQTLTGNWKIHYIYGGLTGHQRVDLNNSYFKYLPNDSMYLIIEGTTWVATNKTNWTYKQTEFGFNTWVLRFEISNGVGLWDELYPSIIYNDTLSLGQNSVDPISYNMTKIP
ncbi:MAG: hypothetical protein H3C48_08640 [Chitinophagaceae bacterium]|nr:hypothetical protein [Chitinophagaceae bacterium]